METTMLKCHKCGTPYHRFKSTAELKYSYCSNICQTNDIGGTTDDLMDYLDSLSLTRSLKDLTKETADVV